MYVFPNVSGKHFLHSRIVENLSGSCLVGTGKSNKFDIHLYILGRGSSLCLHVDSLTACLNIVVEVTGDVHPVLTQL